MLAWWAYFTHPALYSALYSIRKLYTRHCGFAWYSARKPSAYSCNTAKCREIRLLAGLNALFQRIFHVLSTSFTHMNPRVLHRKE